MPTTSKIQGESMNLTDTYAFTGTVTGAGGGSLTFVSSATASNSASIAFTGLDDTYDRYKITIRELVPQTDNTELDITFGTGGTPTYASADYTLVARTSATNGPWADTQRTSQSEIAPTAGILAMGTGTGENLNGEFTFAGMANSSLYSSVAFHIWGQNQSSANTVSNSGAGGWKQSTAVTAIKFAMNSGNLVSGDFRLYGLAKS